MIGCGSSKDAKGACSPGNVLKLRPSNFWKCIETVNSTITMLFCIIVNLYDPIRRTFWLPGDAWAPRAHTQLPTGYGPEEHTQKPNTCANLAANSLVFALAAMLNIHAIKMDPILTCRTNKTSGFRPSTRFRNTSVLKKLLSGERI